MEATHTRLLARISLSAEWVTAAAFLVATLAVGSLIVRELRIVPQALASRVGEASATAPVVPPEAVSVPTLMLGEGTSIAVGDPMTAAAARLGSSVVLIRRAEERGPLGSRDIRWYEVAGARFILVFEPFERRGEPRVAAIYLQ